MPTATEALMNASMAPFRQKQRYKSVGSVSEDSPGDASPEGTVPSTMHTAIAGNDDVLAGPRDSTTKDNHANTPASLPPPPSSLLLTMEEALERVGVGRYQFGIGLAAGLCISADAIEIMLLAFLSLVLEADWQLSSTAAASILSSSFLGSLLGTLLLGAMGDRYGRRPIFLVAAATICVFGVLSAAVQNIGQLVVARFLVGFGMGGSTLGFDSLAEVLPTNQRGKNLMYLQFFWTTGSVLVPALAYLTLREPQPQTSSAGWWEDNITNVAPWRVFVLICAFPCLFAFVLGVWLVPESPRWLAEQGRTDEALAILRQATRTNGLDPQEAFPLHTRLAESVDPSASMDSPEDQDDQHYPQHNIDTRSNSNTRNNSILALLCSRKWLNVTWRLLVAGFAEGFLYYGTVLAVTLVFSSPTDTTSTTTGQGNTTDTSGPTTTARTTSYNFDYGAIITSSSAETVGVVLVVFVVDRVGRIRTQIASWTVGGLSTALLCLLHYNISSNNSGSSNGGTGPGMIVLVALSFLARALAFTGASTLWITVTEILTTDVRATGHSITYAAGRIGGFLCPYAVNPSSSLTAVGLVVLFVSLVDAAALATLPETLGAAMGKKGDTLKGKQAKSDVCLPVRSFSDRIMTE